MERVQCWRHWRGRCQPRCGQSTGYAENPAGLPVVGLGAGGTGGGLGSLEVKTPGLAEYGKLSPRVKPEPRWTAVHDLSGPPDGAKAQVRQLKTRPLSSVGRASPW